MSETFGQALRRFRMTAGLSQVQLRRQAHIDQSSLSRYENDRQRPAVDTAERLDALLGAGGYLRALGTGNAAADVNTPEDAEQISRALAAPHRIDPGAVRALEDVLTAQRRLDDTISPAPMISSVSVQADTAATLVKQAAGPFRAALAEVAAEWTQFLGWLHAEARDDATALRMLSDAEHAADEAGSGVLAAQAANFRGYVARQQDNPRGIVRWFLAEHNTPGANVHQRIGSAAQAADGCARLGDHDGARRLLDTAESLLDEGAEVPAPRTAYWLDTNFHRLNLGLGYLSLQHYGMAVDHLASGLDGLPDDQQGSEWTCEYWAALEQARQHA